MVNSAADVLKSSVGTFISEYPMWNHLFPTYSQILQFLIINSEQVL